jgi:hypothetical protein
MEKKNVNTTRPYFIAMGVYWLVFGLITIFAPQIMGLFQTDSGVSASTAFSDHVWMHGGLDILALCILVFALSGIKVSGHILRATALAALMPAIAITYSLIATNYWNPLFIGAGLGCFAFVVWGFVLAAKSNDIAVQTAIG